MGVARPRDNMAAKCNMLRIIIHVLLMMMMMLLLLLLYGEGWGCEKHVSVSVWSSYETRTLRGLVRMLLLLVLLGHD
jgi:hypothetical protein